MQTSYDVFVSYAHTDGARVKPLVEALRAHGLRVWFDEREIADFASITRGISDGLAKSKALVACYSDTYPTRRACQWELTAAFISGQHEGDPRRRVFVLNLEDHVQHINPIELRDALFRILPRNSDAAALVDIAERVKLATKELPGTLSEIRPLGSPPWYGWNGLGSNRFVGRTATFWDLHSKLHANDVAAVTGQVAFGHAQVRGMGGIGKSLLAEEYALRFGAAFPGGVFVLRGSSDRDTQIVHFAATMGIATTGLQPAEIAGAIERHLRQAAVPYLWLVDDLPIGLAEDERRAWFAPNSFGKTLITTRSRERASTGGIVDLGMLGAAEAYDLLTARRKPLGEGEEAGARELVRELGYHALAVDVAGGALAALSGRETFVEFLAKVREPKRDALAAAAALSPDLPNGHEASIAATLLRSIESLDEPGKDFLRLATVLAPDLIPDDLVDAVLPATSPWGAVASVRAVLDHSLAEHYSGEAQATSGYQVHSLVRRTVKFCDPSLARQEELRTLAVTALTRCLTSVNDVREHPRLQTHVTHARHFASAPGTLDEANLLSWIGVHDFKRGFFASARAISELVFAKRHQFLGDKHPDTLGARGNMAVVLRDMGDLPAARVVEEEVLAAMQQVLGEQHPRTLQARGNLATTLGEMGDLAGARMHQEKVLAGMRAQLGDKAPNTLIARGHLATTLHEQGDLAGARAHQEEVLATSQQVLGQDHADTLAARSNLAQTILDQGDLAGARAHQEEVLVGTHRLLGDDHPDTITAHSALAVTLSRQGDLKGARTHSEKVLAARLRIFGGEHPASIRARGNLSNLLREQGELTASLTEAERALASSQRVLGDEHPDTLVIKNNLALTLLEMADFVRARELQEQVLAEHLRSLGDKHLDTLSDRINLAQTLFKQGNLKDARAHQEAVLEAAQEAYGREHPVTLNARSCLAGTLHALGEHHAARAHLEAVLEEQTRTLGHEAPGTLITRHNLGETMHAQGDLASARACQEGVLIAMRRVLGNDHPRTLDAQDGLAGTLYAQGDFAGARAEQESLLGARCRVLGEGHPDTFRVRRSLVQTLRAQRDLTSARAHQEEVLVALQRAHGDEHVSTLEARDILANIMYAQGDFGGAWKHEDAVLAVQRRLLGDEHPSTLLAKKNMALIMKALARRS